MTGGIKEGRGDRAERVGFQKISLAQRDSLETRVRENRETLKRSVGAWEARFRPPSAARAKS